MSPPFGFRAESGRSPDGIRSDSESLARGRAPLHSTLRNSTPRNSKQLPLVASLIKLKFCTKRGD